MNSLRRTQELISHARAVGFSRRELFQYTALASGAMLVAACGGSGGKNPFSTAGGDASVQPINKFAIGTWRVSYQIPPYSDSAPETETETFHCVITDGAAVLTYPEHPSDPARYNWRWQYDTIDISSESESAVASNVPQYLSATGTFNWTWGASSPTQSATATRGPGSGTSIPASWDATTQTLTLQVRSGVGKPFTVSATKIH